MPPRRRAGSDEDGAEGVSAVARPWSSATASARRPARVRRVTSAMSTAARFIEDRPAGFGPPRNGSKALMGIILAEFEGGGSRGRRSGDAVGQRRLDGGAGVEGAEHLDRRDGGPGEFRRDVVRDGGEPEHLDAQRRPGRPRRASSSALVMCVRPRLSWRRATAWRTASSCRSSWLRTAVRMKSGAVGVEAVAHHQVDAAEVDEAEIDRDLLAVRHLGPQLVNGARHPVAFL